MTTVEPNLHCWMNKTYPRTGRCEHCSSTDRKTEYASIGHVYTRDRADWLELCRSCHQTMDGYPAQTAEKSAAARARMSAAQRGKSISFTGNMAAATKRRWDAMGPEERAAQGKRGWETRRRKQAEAS